MNALQTRTAAIAIIAPLALIACSPVAVQAQPAMLGFRTPQQQSLPQDQAGESQEPQADSPLHPQPPATLTLPAGMIITVESVGFLASDKQHDGDTFVAELQNPLVIDGWVVARPGQTVIGQVTSSSKAGRVKGRSKLALEIRQVVLVNGRQLAVESEVVKNSGSASHGRDLAAVAITTGVGAAIGAVCGAKGAEIGAAVGAGAGIAGVLLTRGEEIEIGPEKLLTFRLASPITVSTEDTQDAFRPVTEDDYIIPNKVGAVFPGSSGRVIVAPPQPIGIPISVLLNVQSLSVARPGHNECGR